jgi:DNA-binding NtrC family response regulator
MKQSSRLLLVEDDESTVFGYATCLNHAGFDVAMAGTLQEARRALDAEQFSAVVLDLKLPDGDGKLLIEEVKRLSDSTGIVVITGTGDVSTAVDAMRRGADNFLTKPVDTQALLASLEKSVEVGTLRRRTEAQQRIVRPGEPYFGTSRQMRQVMEYARVTAGNNTVVLINGETGTGKGVLAKWIHDHSERKYEPFVELNCSSLKGELLRSELFGHVKGSFTSAIRDRAGLLEAADGGTLFLDEIGDMDLEVQAQLLKTIEERSFRRIGENRVRHSDFRLICATNRVLEEESQRGGFRKDLYYRICVFPITIPPIRERMADLPGLTAHLLAEFGYPHGPVSQDVFNVLMRYDWPGSIRELRNMLERALLLAKGEPLHPSHFPGLGTASRTTETPTTEVWRLDRMTALHIQRVIDHFGGDKRVAARALGLSLSSLYRRLEKARAS